jgi:hypothetical protein
VRLTLKNTRMRLRRIALVAVALISVGIGAHTLNPRQLYSEMYPVEPVKRDAFHICDETDPTFVRAVGGEREACYLKMPHAMAVAMGRVKPGGALSLQALTDPSREAELLMMLAATPPRQPITAPRSFSNTAWVRALSPPCEAKPTPAVAYTVPGTLPPASDDGRAAALDSAIRNNLLPLPRPAPTADPKRSQLRVIALAPGRPAAGSASGDATASSAPLPAPDVGDDAAPAVIPLATAGNSCGGA